MQTISKSLYSSDCCYRVALFSPSSTMINLNQESRN
jgi:hypothetical protein